MANSLVGFRAWPKNRERLKFAKDKKIDVAEVINEALEKCGKEIIEAKIKKLREALTVPVP